MLRTALRNILAHKARLVMTALAVMLGVAFVSGTLVFGDSVTQAFRDASSQNLNGVATSVQSEHVPDADHDARDGHTTALTSDLAEEISALPDVTSVHPTVNGRATLAAADGSPLDAGSHWQNLATNYVPDAEDNGQDRRFPLATGRGPAAADEIALESRSADRAGYKVGDTVRFATEGPTLTKTLVGTVTTDDPRVTAGGSLALFDTATAQHLFLQEGQFDELLVSSAPGTDNEALTDEIRDLLPAEGAKATSGARLADEQAERIAQSTKALTQMLLVFAGIALFVGVFIIANTFTMLVSQRSRETALLRAVGATRRQVVRSVLVEAALIGFAASAAGFGIGLGIAWAMRPLLNSGGAGLPDGPLVISPSAFVWSLVVGVGVTVLAAWLPACRAARVAPVEVLSAVDQMPPARALARRNSLGGMIGGSGVLVMLYVATLDNGTEDQLLIAMAGSALTLIGVIMLAPLLSRPLISLTGRLTTRLFGVHGKLAQENALRNPRRTAATASALMIGLALVTGLSVAGDSTDAALQKEAVHGLTADYQVSMERGLDTELGERVDDVSGVVETAALTSAALEMGGHFTMVTGAHPEQLSYVADLTFVSGSLADVGPGTVAISEELAERTGLATGDTVGSVLGSGSHAEAEEKDLTVAGVYQETRAVDGALGQLDEIQPHSWEGKLDSVLVQAEDGRRTAGLDQDIREALGNSPLLKVQTQEQLVQEESAAISVMLAMVYGLLGMSIVIAVLGVINTLAMSVFERTREIVLLRAIGLDRRGVRQMVRLESVVISLFGAVLGIGTGIFLAWAGGNLVGGSLATYETALPWASLGLFLLLALAIGVLAAIWPARRAAGQSMLGAINAQ